MKNRHNNVSCCLFFADERSNWNTLYLKNGWCDEIKGDQTAIRILFMR